MMELVGLFREQGYDITFATTAAPTLYSTPLESLNVKVESILLNNPLFDKFINGVNPDVVLFDRYITEEQFGWRVAEQCPKALRILDTEDLHFLRKAREEAFGKGQEVNLYSDIAKRELASILRSDLSLIISEAEMKLLKETFQIPEGLLAYLPLFVESVFTEVPSFEERQHFITMGNFQHAPNADSVVYLKNELWPHIKKQLPEAELHIYGAYVPKYISEMHNEKQGFLIKGWAKEVSSVMKSARVCLAPLRFGAGLKGKLLDAAQFGVPSVTTTIGGEGMFEISVQEDAPDQFVDACCRLYQEKDNWLLKQRIAFQTLEKQFKKELFSEEFSEKIRTLRSNLPKHRASHFIGQILQQETLKATKYLSKWIEAKNK